MFSKGTNTQSSNLKENKEEKNYQLEFIICTPSKHQDDYHKAFPQFQHFNLPINQQSFKILERKERKKLGRGREQRGVLDIFSVLFLELKMAGEFKDISGQKTKLPLSTK